MANRIPAYSGEEPFAFVSYSHKDSRVVYPIIERLTSMGYNVWYDEGIPLVVDYGGVLYEKIMKCSLFVLFVSNESVKSKDVEKEAAHAISFGKDIAQIVIDEDAKLPYSIAYHLPKTRQYLSITAEPSEFWRHLCATLSPCKAAGAVGQGDEVIEEKATATREVPPKPSAKTEVAAKRKGAKVSIIVISCVFVAVVCVTIALLSGGSLSELRAPTNADVSITDVSVITIGGKDISTNVTELDLSNTGLTDDDLALLTKLTKLTSLNLSDNNISDISPLAKLTKLTVLWISGNPLTNPDSLQKTIEGLPNINMVFCSDCGISDEALYNINISLPDVEILWRLSLGNRTILTNCTATDLSWMNLEDISPLRYATNLTTLKLSVNEISDISPLANLTELTYLSLYHNSITDISPLANLTNLTHLDLDSNNITDISPLANLTNLTELYLSDNNISDISPLLGLKKLQYLQVINCGLSADEKQQLKDALPNCKITFKRMYS